MKLQFNWRKIRNAHFGGRHAGGIYDFWLNIPDTDRTFEVIAIIKGVDSDGYVLREMRRFKNKAGFPVMEKVKDFGVFKTSLEAKRAAEAMLKTV